MPLADGEMFAGYTILRLLGLGGMGEVYLAQHPRLPRRDALKVLGNEVSADDDYRKRFVREADLAAVLWHPNIVHVNDRGDFNGQLWISMDFVDGTDAASLLRDRYPAGMPADEVATIVDAIASALDYAHHHGLLHRDIKPANILLANPEDRERRILLTDFGIARDVNDVSELTKTNMTVGTVAYCAPEQLLGEDIDGRADQYSLAASAYHLLTGSQPFPNSNPAVVISQHLNVPPPVLADRRSELAKLDPVLAIGLAKRREDRFEVCSYFARALSEQINSVNAPTTSAPTVSAPRATPAVDAVAKPSRRPTVPVAVFVAIFLIALIGAVVLLLRPARQDGAANSTTSTAASAAPAVTFESMRDFVTRYYADLPAHPTDAWAKLDTHCQDQTGQRQFLEFWATIQSVTLVSVSPRDATSVVARLKYVRRNGTSDSEDRWLEMVFVNGAMLIDESGRIGSASESPTSPPQPLFSPKTIDQVLLTDDQLNNLLGVNVTTNPAGGGGGSALAIKSSSYGMSDHSGQVKPKSCVGVAFTGEHDVYATADPSAIKIETFGEQYGGSGSNAAPYWVEQTAAIFASDEQAQQFLKYAQAQWSTCSNSEVDVTLGFENGRAFRLGDVRREGDLITIRMASWGGLNGLHACQQALGFRANVVAEARTCEEPSVPNFNWQDPVNPAWASPTAAPLVNAMLNKVKI
jgi:serine/threonine-protein kinase